jgi:hypothetical protein
MINYNSRHIAGDMVVSIGSDVQMTIGDLRNAIARFPDDAAVLISPCSCCWAVQRLTGFDVKGPGELLLNIEGHELDLD